MSTAIVAKLKSIIDSQTKILELNDAGVDWQEIVDRAIERDDSPIYLLFPQTISEVAKIVKQAAQHRWRILICGNGTKLNWGKTARDVRLILSLQQCDRLIEHAVGDLTVTVEAGMRLKTVQHMLRSHNQFLPIDSSYNSATLGGIVATGDTGSYRQRYGGVKDLLLGISFVRADGEIAKAGGRVVKNVAGYDLMKLFTGAYGTLGIISQLTFRTFPLMPTSKTLLLTGKAAKIAGATQSVRNSGLTPVAMDLLSTAFLQQLGIDGEIGLVMRWQAIPESVQQQIEQITAIAQKLDLASQTCTEELADKLWSKPQANILSCKLGIVPAAAVNFLQLKEVGERVAVRIHASSGIGQLWSDTEIPYETLEQMRSCCQQNYGFLTVLDAPQDFKQQIDIWGYRGNALKAMNAIKKQFDPQNILNCDRYIV